MEYINLKPENDAKIEPPKPDEKPPNFDNFAKRGEIVFKDLSLKYSEDSHRILKSLNLRIKPGEKIGICGRTGAGKSSIIQAIFRLAHNEGIIEIDDVDISTMPLYQLRKNISIIPQEAILFSGTMRDNLDPFSEKSDDELWKALDQVSFRFDFWSLFVLAGFGFIMSFVCRWIYERPSVHCQTDWTVGCMTMHPTSVAGNAVLCAWHVPFCAEIRYWFWTRQPQTLTTTPINSYRKPYAKNSPTALFWQ